MSDIDNIKYKRIELHGITHSGEVEVHRCINRSELDRLTLELFDRYRVVKQVLITRGCKHG